MQLERWQKIETVFEAVADLEKAERADALARLCGSDDELRSNVEELLAADSGDGLLDVANSGNATKGLLDTGSMVGAYRITGVLGEGGSSTVYRAVRADRQYEQEVAVKVLRGSFHGPYGTHRFRQERQILADLDHPGIARLLDGGAVEDSPFLVMELVDGQPITDHCVARNLPIKQRLELFLEILDAVQYAHRRLIVHRDLKPGNILVRSDGLPKLLDFGISKLLDPQAHLPGGEPTRSDLLLMTPSYASPEQLRGQTVTTASDVYSLGVVLYRLLTDCRPYDVDTADLSAMVEAVCGHEPMAPSKAAPARRRWLKGDLDHISAKALAKDPERRYPTADAFAADLTHYLNGEPVEARAAGFGYRLGKLVRKHRWPVAAAATIFALTVAFAISVGIQARKTGTALRVAETEHQKADAVNDLLLRLLTSADPSESGGRRDVTLLEAIQRTERFMGTALGGQPGVEGAVRGVLGAGYRTLGELDRAEALLRQALDLQGQANDTEGLVVTRTELSRLLLERGNAEAAAEVLRAALTPTLLTVEAGQTAEMAILSATGEPTWPIVFAAARLGLVVAELGRLEEAENWYGAAVSAAASAAGGAEGSGDRWWAELATIGSELATARGDLELAVVRAAAALARSRAAFGDESLPVAQALQLQGAALYHVGRYPEAETSLREARRLGIELLGREHPLVAGATVDLGAALRAQAREQEAEESYLEALDIYRTVSGNDHPETARALVSLSHVYLAQLRTEEAATALEEALAIVRPLYGDDHQRTTQILEPLARVYELQGDLEAAESLQRQVLVSRLRVLGERHFLVAYSRGQLAGFLLDNDRAEEAEPLYRKAMESLHQQMEPGNFALAQTTWGLGRSLFLLGRTAESVEVLLKAATEAPQLMQEDWRYCGRISSTLAEGLQRLDKSEEAAVWRARNEACPPAPSDA